MIVLVMVLLAALAAGAVAAYVLGVDAGYVLFTWQGWVLESTLDSPCCCWPSGWPSG